MDFEKHGLSYHLPPLIAIRLLPFTDVSYRQKIVTNQGFQLLIRYICFCAGVTINRYICFCAGITINGRDASFTDQELQHWYLTVTEQSNDSVRCARDSRKNVRR